MAASWRASCLPENGRPGLEIQDNGVRQNYAVGITGKDGSKLIGSYVHDNGQIG